MVEDPITGKKSRSSIYSFIEFISDPAFVFSNLGRIKRANSATELFLNREKKEFMGRNIFQLFSTVPLQNHINHLKEVGGKIEFEEFLPQYNGYFKFSLMSYYNENIVVVKELFKREYSIDILRHLIDNTKSTGTQFFIDLVKALTQVLGTNYAFVGEIMPNDPNTVQTVAFCREGQILDNCSYGLSHTPCANVISESTCFYNSNVIGQFPLDQMLADMKIESYLGTPLRSSEGKTIGLLVLLSESPLNEKLNPAGILEHFAGRAGAELERERTLNRLIESEERFRSLNACSPIGVFMADSAGNCTYTNAVCQEICGFTYASALGTGWTDFIHPDDKEAVMKEWASGKSNFQKEFRFRHLDGKDVWVLARTATLKNETNQSIGLIGTVEDITENKQFESEREKLIQDISSSLVEKETLLKEIHHRVKNNLQVISSLLNLQLNTQTDPKVREIINESQTRVRGMALIHEHLYRSKSISTIDFEKYVNELIDNIFSFYQSTTKNLSYEIDIENISFDPDLAINLGLILTEIITNSIKHAFPNREEGVISVTMKKTAGRFELIIKDNGCGINEGLNYMESKSLGMQLINSLVYQLSGELSMKNNDGCEFKITFSPSEN